MEEDLEHVLVKCKALEKVRKKLCVIWYTRSAKYHLLYELIARTFASDPEVIVKFIY